MQLNVFFVIAMMSWTICFVGASVMKNRSKVVERFLLQNNNNNGRRGVGGSGLTGNFYQQRTSSNQEDEVDGGGAGIVTVGNGLARNFMIRRPRSGRIYDVPQIECPRSDDRLERFACPTPDYRDRYRCIDDRSLCDGFYDCPGKEDENPEQCLFYKTTKAHLDILAEALLRWARGR